MTTIAELFAKVRPDVDQREFRKAGEKSGQQLGDGLEKGTNQGIRKGVQSGADKAGPAAGKRISAGVSTGLSDGKISGRLSGVLSAGVASFGPAAAGAAIGLGLLKGITGALERETGTAKLQAQLGIDPKLAKELGGIAGKTYAEAYGGSLGEVTGAVRLVAQNISNITDEGAEGVEGMTKKVLNLASTFEVDLGAATRGVGQLLKTGLARNATEAMDVITAGFQAGVDKSEDFLDTLNEYSTQFRKLGLNGATATGILSQGLKAGARDADIVADSLKEFSIRAVDGSKLTADSFKALGLSGKQMIADIAQGGPKASAALQLTLDKLRGIKDPALQAQIAVGLFGTQAEDMGKALFAIDPRNAVNALGQVGGAASKMDETLVTSQTRIDSFKRTVMSRLTDAGAGILKFFADVQANPDVKNFLGEARTFLVERVLPALRTFGGWVQDRILPLLVQFGKGLREQAIENFHKLERAFRENEPELRQLWNGFKAFAEIMATKVVPAVIRFYFGAMKPTIDFIANVGIPVIGQMIRHFLTGMKVVLTGVSVFLNGVEKMAGVMRLIPGPIGKLWQTIYDKSRTARAGVDQVRGALDRVPKNTTANVRADTSQAKAAVSAFQGQLYNLVRKKYDAVISGRLDYFGNPIKASKDGGMLPGRVNASRRKDDGIFFGQAGEWVVPVDRTRQYLPILKAITEGTLEQHANGGLVGDPWWVRVGANVAQASALAAGAARSGKLAAFGGPYGLGTSSGSAIANIVAIARSIYPGARLSSGYRPGDPGYHGRGWAADIVGGGAAGMARIARGFYAISGRLLELIHSGGGGFFVKNGRRVGAGYYSSVLSGHYNHVHIAKRANADLGADLMPGWNPPLYNGTGAVERLRPVRDGGPRGSWMFAPTYNMAHPVSPQEVARETMTRLMFTLSTGAAPAGGGI